MKDRLHLKAWRAETLHKNSFFAVKKGKDAVRKNEYRYIEFSGPGVRIVAKDDRGRVLLVRQYRHPIGRYTWEIPAGGVEQAEELLAAARRELYEETGFDAKSWKQLGNVVSLPNATNFEAAVFLATHLALGQTRLDTPENSEVNEARFFDTSELQALITDGELCDDKSLAALHLEQTTSRSS